LNFFLKGWTTCRPPQLRTKKYKGPIMRLSKANSCLDPDKTDETGWAGILGLAVPNLCSLF